MGSEVSNDEKILLSFLMTTNAGSLHPRRVSVTNASKAINFSVNKVARILFGLLDYGYIFYAYSRKRRKTEVIYNYIKIFENI